jgi:membrane associated rhomboid family serine protease
MKYLIFILTGIIIIVCCGVFFLVKDSLQRFSFSGVSFFKGEFYRLITFPFTHVSKSHLLENIVAITITCVIGFELGLRGQYFAYCFLLSSFIVALTEAFLFPILVITGASLGIYSILGAVSLTDSNLIPKYVLIPLLGASVFLKYLFSFSHEILQQSLFHFAGFVCGISLIFLFSKLKKKKRVLQVMGNG